MILQLRVQFVKEAFEGLDLLQKTFHVLWSIVQLSPEIMDFLRARGDKADHGDEAGGERDRFHGGHGGSERLSNIVLSKPDVGHRACNIQKESWTGTTSGNLLGHSSDAASQPRSLTASQPRSLASPHLARRKLRMTLRRHSSASQADFPWTKAVNTLPCNMYVCLTLAVRTEAATRLPHSWYDNYQVFAAG